MCTHENKLKLSEVLKHSHKSSLFDSYSEKSPIFLWGTRRESQILLTIALSSFKNYIKFNNTITAIKKMAKLQMK